MTFLLQIFWQLKYLRRYGGSEFLIHNINLWRIGVFNGTAYFFCGRIAFTDSLQRIIIGKKFNFML